MSKLRSKRIYYNIYMFIYEGGMVKDVVTQLSPLDHSRKCEQKKQACKMKLY